MQVFKTKSNVLNSGVNIVLVAFCLLAVTKLAHWPMSGLRPRKYEILKLKQTTTV